MRVAAALDTSQPWDLALVTVPAFALDPLLPALVASRAATVMFAFNTFDALAPLRQAVGAHRAEFAFPSMTAFLVDGRLKYRVTGPGLVTTTSSAAWAATFRAAGLPAAVQADMQSFLRSHVAFVAPLMVAGLIAHGRQAGVTWPEAARLSRALAEGLAVVRQSGNAWMPGMVRALATSPRGINAALIWLLSRTAPGRDVGQFGPAEVRTLIDAMVATAPEATPTLRAIRP